MTDLTCPKCLSTMRSIDRQGVIIERCESCGGVFLDRHELDQLIRLENTFMESQFQESRGRRRDRRDDYRDRDRDRDDDDWFDDDDDDRGGVRGLLENLFDLR